MSSGAIAIGLVIVEGAFAVPRTTVGGIAITVGSEPCEIRVETAGGKELGRSVLTP